VRRGVFALTVLGQLVALYWPRPVEPGTALPLDKLVHVAIFGAVLWAGVRAGLRPGPLAAVLVVHAGLSEVVQSRFLERDGDVADAVADVIGVALAWLVTTRAGRPAPAGDTPADGGAPDRR
jgi:VanZ family protein